MNKQIATNAIKLLDRVETKGHQEREIMNEVCNALLEIVNAPEKKEPDGKADAK